jgi:hypothetical protein
MEVIGPHRRRSGRDGVIQFKIVLSPCIAMAAYAVQAGQLGARPAADVTLAAINKSNGTDTAAVTFPEIGSAPSLRPPWVKRPQGAPNIKQN